MFFLFVTPFLRNTNRGKKTDTKDEFEGDLDDLSFRACIKVKLLVVKKVNRSLARVHDEAASLDKNEAGCSPYNRVHLTPKPLNEKMVIPVKGGCRSLQFKQ